MEYQKIRFILASAIGFLLVLPAQAALVAAYPALAPWRAVAAALILAAILVYYECKARKRRAEGEAP